MQVTDQITITVYGVLTVTITGPDRGYVGREAEFTASWTGPLEGPWHGTVDWGDGVVEPFSSFAPSVILRHTYDLILTYGITVDVVDEGSGAVGTGFHAISIQPLLTADLLASPTSGIVPLPVTFTINVQGGHPPYSWSLNPGDGEAPYTGTADAATVPHTYETDGRFIAVLTVNDQGPMVVQAEIPILAGVIPEAAGWEWILGLAPLVFTACTIGYSEASKGPR